MPAGSLLVRGLLLRNSVLPSRQLVDSGLATPAPLAFNLSSNAASLVLDSCTLSTSCDNLAQFAAWLSEQPYVNATQVGRRVRESVSWGGWTVGDDGRVDGGRGVIGGGGGSHGGVQESLG